MTLMRLNNKVIFIIIFAITLLNISCLNPEKAKEDEINKLRAKGIEHMVKQEYEESLKCYDKILELEPENVDALGNKASLLKSLALNLKDDSIKKEEKLREAVACYDKALKIDPENFECWFSKGDILDFHLHDYKDALLCFEKALEYADQSKASLVQSINGRISKCKEKIAP